MNYHTVSIGMQRRQPQDACALVITERRADDLSEAEQQEQAAWDRARGRKPLASAYTVRQMYKLPPGLPYPALADELGKIVTALSAHAPAAISLLIDATGLGQPIMDLYRERLAETEARITPCLLASHDRCEDGEDERGRRQCVVGKRYLLNRLQILLQTNDLKLPKSREAEEVAEDLLRPPPPLHPAEDALLTGGFAVGRQDGLLTALGLAVIVTRRVRLWMPNVQPTRSPDPHGFTALAPSSSWLRDLFS